jgi:hypothetical protein
MLQPGRVRSLQAVGVAGAPDGDTDGTRLADLAGYLKARQVEQGWSVKRMHAELRVGRRWLVGELARLGLRS